MDLKFLDDWELIKPQYICFAELQVFLQEIDSQIHKVRL